MSHKFVHASALGLGAGVAPVDDDRQEAARHKSFAGATERSNSRLGFRRNSLVAPGKVAEVEHDTGAGQVSDVELTYSIEHLLMPTQRKPDTTGEARDVEARSRGFNGRSLYVEPVDSPTAPHKSGKQLGVVPVANRGIHDGVTCAN